jgi:hypothetical protein
MPATGDYYFSLMRCNGLDYSDTVAWINDLSILQADKDYLIPRVLHIGGLAYEDWIYLLDVMTFTGEHTKEYFLSQFTSCGYMDMTELVNAVEYPDDAITGIFNPAHFSPTFD